MTSGRRPLPDAVKKMKGTLRPDRTNKKAPKVKANFPKPCRGLTKDEKAAWRWLAKIIGPMEIAGAPERAVLKLLVRVIVRWERACATILEEGEYYEAETRQGGTLWKLHPSVAVAQADERYIFRLLLEFGLTPAARSSVSAKNQNTGNPRDKILSFIRGGQSASS